MAQFIDLEKHLSQTYGKSEVWNLSKISEKYKNIKLDLAFQRRGPWTEEHRIDYLKSVLSGKASTNITIVDAKECLVHFEKKRDEENDKGLETSDSIAYYSKLIENGYEYVSIDGNNRSKTIEMLLDNEIGLPEMNIPLDEEDEENYIIIPEKTTLKQLSEGNGPNNKPLKNKNGDNVDINLCKQIQEKIVGNFEIKFNILHQASKSHLNESFLNINEGIEVNKQEKRNAIEGSVSTAIRNMGKKYNQRLYDIGVFTKAKLKSKAGEELFSRFLEAEMQGTKPNEINISNVDDKKLDELFLIEASDTDSFIKRTDNLIKNVIKLLEFHDGKMDLNEFHNAYIFIKNLTSHTYVINDFEKVAKIFNKMMNDLKDIKYYQKSEYWKNYKEVPEGIIPFRGSNIGKSSGVDERNETILKYLEHEKIFNENLHPKETILTKDELIKIDGRLKEEVAPAKRRKKPDSKLTLTMDDLDSGTENYLKNDFQVSLHSDTEKSFLDLQTKTLVDKTIQREPSWNAKKEGEFIESLIKGHVFTDIIVADIKKCYDNTQDEYFKDIGLDAESMKKRIQELEELKKKTPAEKRYPIEDRITVLENILETNAENLDNLPLEYVSIDGNNRSNTLEKFLKGDIKLPEMTVKDDNGKEVFLKSMTWEQLQEMPNIKKIIQLISNVEINFTTMVKATKQDINEAFLKVNEGVAVNAQEKRNAQNANMSHEIRELSDKYQKYFDPKKIKKDWKRPVLGVQEWKERTDDELLTQLWGLERYGQSFTVLKEPELDALFQGNKGEESLTQEFKDKIELTFDFLTKLDYIGNKKIDKYYIQNVFMVISNLMISKSKKYMKDNLDKIFTFVNNQFDELSKSDVKFTIIREGIEIHDASFSHISKSLTTITQLMKREEIIMKLSNDYIISEYKENNDTETLAFKAKQAEDNLNFILNKIEEYTENDSDENKVEFASIVKERLSKMDDETKSLFYQLAIESDAKIKKDAFIRIEKFDEARPPYQIIKNVLYNDKSNQEQLINMIDTDQMEKDIFKNLLTIGITKEYSYLKESAEDAAKVEIKAWILTFIKYDYEALERIIKSPDIVKEIKDTKKIPYLEINKRIFEAINQRGITVHKRRGGEVIKPPFIISKDNTIHYNVKNKVTEKGIPDVIYFPKTDKGKEIIGCSATASSTLTTEGTQFLRHPKRLNKLLNYLKKEGKEINDDLIRELQTQKSKNSEQQEKVIGIISTQKSGDKLEIKTITDNLKSLKTIEEKNKYLDELYGLQDNADYLFLGQIKQSIMKNDFMQNEEEYISLDEVIHNEKRTIDLFVYAQKTNILNNITGSSISEMKDQELLFKYLYSNIINVITSKDGTHSSFPKGRSNELEITELLINDLLNPNIEDTTYFKFLPYQGKINNNKKELVYTSLKQSLQYLKNIYYGDIQLSEEETEVAIELFKNIASVNLEEPNYSIEMDSNDVSSLIRSVISDVKRGQSDSPFASKLREKPYDTAFEAFFEDYEDFIKSSDLSTEKLIQTIIEESAGLLKTFKKAEKVEKYKKDVADYVKFLKPNTQDKKGKEIKKKPSVKRRM